MPSSYIYIRVKLRNQELVIYGLEDTPIEILNMSDHDLEEKFTKALEILDRDGWEATHETNGFIYMRKPIEVQ